MLLRRLASAAVTCAVASVAIGALPGCGGEEHEGPRREGLAIELGGVTYNVLITRQLNLAAADDRGYARLPQPPPGSTYYGVFLQACNVSDEPQRSASSFTVVNQQDEEFDPVALEPENPYAYEPRELEPDECIPEVGSLAAEGPTGGSLLVFEIPTEATENRPLELEVSHGFDLEAGQPEQLLFELDI